MAFEARIIADSIAPCRARLTTWVLSYPLSIHNELMTHREWSRNTASSRAIPTHKLIQRVINDPFTPMYIGANQAGMQAGEELSGEQRERIKALWDHARNQTVDWATEMAEYGAHKQVVNRMLNPYMWTTAVFSTTSHSNWLGLRDHGDAEPHFHHLAYMMGVTLAKSTPKTLAAHEWHLPFIQDEDYELALKLVGESAEGGVPTSIIDVLTKVSVGRCARVSYLTHDGRRDLKEDVALHDRLLVQRPLHASPGEHVARALDFPQWYKAKPGAYLDVYKLRDAVVSVRRERWAQEPTHTELLNEAALGRMQSGNFLGFQQHRKLQRDEYIGGLMP